MLSAFMLCITGIILFSETDYDSKESIVSFADWLFEQRDYARAAGEYARAIFLEKDRPDSFIRFRLGRSYFLASDFARALKAYQEFLSAFPGSGYARDACYDVAFIYFKTGRFSDSIRQLEILGNGGDDIGEKAGLLSIVDLCLLDQWDKALTAIDNPVVPCPHDLSGRYADLREISARAVAKDEKNPIAAGLLSVVIPGAGKVYSNRFEDGLFSFLVVGTLAGLATYGFYKDGMSSASGWIYASIGSVFYFGDVYGSAMAAINYNRDQAELIRKQTLGIGESLAR